MDILAEHSSELPNYDLVIPALLKNGTDGLREICNLSPGMPPKL
jgi:DNA ligase-1